MDPRVESAIRRACDQLGQNGEAFVTVVKSHLDSKRLHAAVKAEKPKPIVTADGPKVK